MYNGSWLNSSKRCVQMEVTGYTSKSGRTANYKIKAVFKKDGKDRVLLQSFGPKPVEFWVDRDKLVDAMPIKSRPDAATQRCWE